VSASKSYALEERRRVQDIILSAEAVKNVASACDYRSLLAGSDDVCRLLLGYYCALPHTLVAVYGFRCDCDSDSENGRYEHRVIELTLTEPNPRT